MTCPALFIIPLGEKVAIYKGGELVYYAGFLPYIPLEDMLQSIGHQIFTYKPPPLDGSHPLFPMLDGSIRMPQSFNEYIEFMKDTGEQKKEETDKEKMRRLWQEITDIMMKD